MSSRSDLEYEDFAEITLVRMEDIQPSRGSQEVVQFVDELPVKYESCTEDAYIEYIDDEDSNIGSMVSIKSETIPLDHNYTEKYIIPDSIEEIPIEVENPQVKVPPESWPTLEILPGGVIKNFEKSNDKLVDDIFDNSSLDNMYACALCPVGFKYLYSLVKHVKTHKEKKKEEENVKSDSLQKYNELSQNLIVNNDGVESRNKRQIKNKTHKIGVGTPTKQDLRVKPLILKNNDKKRKRLKIKAEPRKGPVKGPRKR